MAKAGHTEHIEKALELSRAVDSQLEVALTERQAMERLMPALFELLRIHLNARGVVVHTLDEALNERNYTYGVEPPSPAMKARIAAGETYFSHGDRAVLGQQLEVAGEELGEVVCLLESPPDDAARASDLLAAWTSGLDNHLAAILQRRRRFEVTRAISDALKQPVLDIGIDRAIEVLAKQITFADLVLFFRHEDPFDDDILRYRVYRNGELRYDSTRVSDDEMHEFLESQAQSFIDGQDERLRKRLGIPPFRDEMLISGIRTPRVIGRLIVTSQAGEFHTYDRELLEGFVDYLRQRIVDFNREWRQLSSMFASATCDRLLRQEDYVHRWLTPRERRCAILFADIAGFTRISERVLREPEAVGRLIDLWVRRSVDAIWETGGVFDKMVGDCVIGLWGPPFFEGTSAEDCKAALRAARAIRRVTRELSRDRSLPELRGLERPLDVAVGISYCPIFVGLFGPEARYTGFSSGMNNTARLQSIASGGEILCMDDCVAATEDASLFGPERSESVKNVQEPLRFRALADDASHS